MGILLKLIKENIVRFNANIERFIGKRYVLTWLDEIFCFIVFGASPDDYFRYEFYRKSLRGRNQFITYRRSKKLIKKYNTSSNDLLKTLNDKSLMNAHFKDFIKREWIDLDKCSMKEFSEFAARQGRVIMKPKGGSGGRGIFILEGEKIADNINEYKGYIAEQLLVQHEEIAKLNPSSVNTLRVMTFKGEIISCVLKIGSGNAVVDNMCSKGMYGNVNLEYGITDSLFYDIELNRYVYHPCGGAKLVGVEIPHWDKIREFTRKAADTVPEINYVGWDVAILQDEFAIIEANEAPGHDLSCQSTVQVGIYKRIKDIGRMKEELK